MESGPLLAEIGLKKNETKVYLALSEIGLTTTSALIKRTGINTSKVYESLERLLKKGLVSYTLIKNKKHWRAEDPSSIREFLQEEKRQIEERVQMLDAAIPQLRLMQQSGERIPQYAVYEGIKGIKSARERVLSVLGKGDTLYIILSHMPMTKTLEGYWLDFQERRARKGIQCRFVMNKEIEQLGRSRARIPLTQIRYVRPEILSPTWIEVYGDYVGMGILNAYPSLFVIHHREIARGFLNYFQVLWKMGK
ncbi:MAG TPA: helix-turn-helix domain-containing protein [Candidatus Nanoarchaeia archaeon]|nr:helix-turn-helix domain-containing protein [Candidatus Nanoarchaeia archaeon]